MCVAAAVCRTSDMGVTPHASSPGPPCTYSSKYVACPACAKRGRSQPRCGHAYGRTCFEAERPAADEQVELSMSSAEFCKACPESLKAYLTLAAADNVGLQAAATHVSAVMCSMHP